MLNLLLALASLDLNLIVIKLLSLDLSGKRLVCALLDWYGFVLSGSMPFILPFGSVFGRFIGMATYLRLEVSALGVLWADRTGHCIGDEVLIDEQLLL